jgi:hypothetical protein
MSSTNLNLPPNAPPSQVGAALGPLFRNLSLLLPSILVIGLIGDVLLTLGFRELSQVDDSKFSRKPKFQESICMEQEGKQRMFSALCSVRFRVYSRFSPRATNNTC